MKVLFVHPPLNPKGETTPPLGICTLAAWLHQHGHTVSILDFDLELRVAADDQRFFFIDTLLKQRIEDFQPAVICVTSMYSNSLYAEYIIRYSKQNASGVTTVAGGSHFGAQAVHSLQRIEELDYVIEGESEVAILELLDYLANEKEITQVHNLVYRADAGILSTTKANLIELGLLPNVWKEIRDIIEIDRYSQTIPGNSDRRIIYVEAGRGCPFECSFCATAPFWKRKYRVKKPEQIIDEIDFLQKFYGYDSFILIHDLLPVNKTFISDLCENLMAKKLSIEWMMNSRTDINLTGYLPKLKAAGCWKIFYGVESASERIQHVISKHLNKEETVNCLKSNLELGILSTCSFVIGFPDETPEEISETVKLAALCKMNGAETIQFHRLRLFPPSRLSTENIKTDFDLDALKIEYPFIEISETEIDEIRNDPVFFMGYHSPRTLAGTSEQLAQLEMFFHHGLAIAPLTISLCCRFYDNGLINSFYDNLQKIGLLKRDEIEWQTDRLFQNWTSIRPLLHALTVQQDKLSDWQHKLLEAVFQYEDARLQFFLHQSSAESLPRTIVKDDHWTAFHSAANIFSVSQSLKYDQEVGPDVLEPCIIVLIEQPNKRLAYMFEKELEAEIIKRDPTIMNLIHEDVSLPSIA